MNVNFVIISNLVGRINKMIELTYEQRQEFINQFKIIRADIDVCIERLTLEDDLLFLVSFISFESRGVQLSKNMRNIAKSISLKDKDDNIEMPNL